jgi:hypothetical protein
MVKALPTDLIHFPAMTMFCPRYEDLLACETIGAYWIGAALLFPNER